MKPDYIQQASGLFLTEPFPDDWKDLTTTSVTSHVNNNVNATYDNLLTGVVVQAIIDTAVELDKAYELGVANG